MHTSYCDEVLATVHIEHFIIIMQCEEKILSFFDKIDYNCDGFINWVRFSSTP